MSTNHAAVETAEEYIVQFTYWYKKGARKTRADGHSVVRACSVSEAVGIVAKRWEEDPAAEIQRISAKSVRAQDAEDELRARDLADKASRKGQIEAANAAMDRIRAARAAKTTK